MYNEKLAKRLVETMLAGYEGGGGKYERIAPLPLYRFGRRA